ncbi:MAG: hypothetical protein FJ264_03785 [Planctomycetes bacterium]|nr:hypothetical protein [Planctomycetota bacterium]
MKDILHKNVLLVGATTGMATNGLLYLTSYLYRNGINALCQLRDNNTSDDALKTNIFRLLIEHHPTLVGVSIKWFQHIARGLRICNLVKSYSHSIKVVVGGNTASYFRYDIIHNENVDYIICGDGELPLLMLCQGKDEIPNFVYKEHRQVKETGFQYIHNHENSEKIFISDIGKIVIEKDDFSSFSYLYINTGKGCNQNCFYCGGSLQTQINTFNRKVPFYRPVKSVRKDILESVRYTDTLMFDFEIIGVVPYNIYEQSFSGIDLKTKNGFFYCWVLPADNLIKLLALTFNKVQLMIDIASLSENHRLILREKGMIKEQPTDEQLFNILRHCSEFKNVSVGFSCILGMPFMEHGDIGAGEEWIKNITDNFPSFNFLEFGRLHAQPGAPMLSTYEDFGMNVPALSFHDYYKVSEMNLEQGSYPDIGHLKYPQITYKDEKLNKAITLHSKNILMMMQRYYREKEKTCLFGKCSLLI